MSGFSLRSPLVYLRPHSSPGVGSEVSGITEWMALSGNSQHLQRLFSFLPPLSLFFSLPFFFFDTWVPVLDQGTSLVHTAGKVVQSYRSTLQSDAAYHHKTEILTSSRLRALCAVRERATNKRLFRALVLKQQLSLFLP